MFDSETDDRDRCFNTNTLSPYLRKIPALMKIGQVCFVTSTRCETHYYRLSITYKRTRLVYMCNKYIHLCASTNVRFQWS